MDWTLQAAPGTPACRRDRRSFRFRFWSSFPHLCPTIDNGNLGGISMIWSPALPGVGCEGFLLSSCDLKALLSVKRSFGESRTGAGPNSPHGLDALHFLPSPKKDEP